MTRATPTPAGSRLDRMLQDPLIRLVMASDRVEEADIRLLAHRLTPRFQAPTPDLPRAYDCAGCA